MKKMMMNFRKHSVVGMTLLATLMQSNPAAARELKSLVAGEICSADDVAAEPMALRPVYVEPQWATKLKSPDLAALFKASEMAKLKEDSNSVRARLSSSHIVSILINHLEEVRAKEIAEIAAGRLKPIEEGKSYSSKDLKAYYEKTDEFKKQIVLPKLRRLYWHAEAVFRQREKLRAREVPPEANQALLARVESQREALNQLIGELMPEFQKKVGVIEKGSLDDLPFSYRDGHIVKIRFTRKGADGRTSERLTVYPRELTNALLGREGYFLKGLRLWHDYAKEKYESALKEKESVSGWLRTKTGDASVEDDVTVRRALFLQAQTDLVQAEKVSKVLASLSSREMLSLLDLLRVLQGENIPRCQQVIKALNEKMTQELKGERSSASKKITAESKAKLDELGKDIAFYQDIYGAFTETASLTLRSSSGK
jgi:hypothetical protein